MRFDPYRLLSYSTISLMMLMGVIYRNCRLYIYSNGLIEEDKITFGLTKFLGIANAPFYELNLLFTAIFVSIGVFVFTKVSERINVPGVSFRILSMVFISSFLLSAIVLILNYEEVVEINPELKPYSLRLLGFLDDSVVTHFRIRVKLSTEEFMVTIYSIVLGLISLLAMMVVHKRKAKIERINPSLIDN